MARLAQALTRKAVGVTPRPGGPVRLLPEEREERRVPDFCAFARHVQVGTPEVLQGRMKTCPWW
jgi:hypothetical protein